MKISKSFLLVGLLWLMIDFLLVLSAWSVPMMINVQGRLTGNPRPPTVKLTIYEGGTETSGGGIIWTKDFYVITSGSPSTSQILVDPTSGLFNVILEREGGPAYKSLPSFLTDVFYLELAVYSGGWKVLIPRQRLVSVPFTITAKNLKGGTVDATGNPAVRGSLSGEATTYGALGKKVTGIFITDVTTVGVYGKAQGDTEVAIMGENVHPTFGYSYARGVEGRGKMGVYGYGSTVGGSFETIGYEAVHGVNSASGEGVLGVAPGSGIGVYGKGWSGPGGKFESTSGPALEIGEKGWIKMPISSTSWRPEGSGTDTDPSTTSLTINSQVGVVEYEGVWGLRPPPGFWMTVYNNKVKSGSTFVKLQAMGGTSGVSSAKLKNVRVGSFEVWCENGEDIAFFVIGNY